MVSLVLAAALVTGQTADVRGDGPNHQISYVVNRDGGKIRSETWTRFAVSRGEGAPDWTRTVLYDAKSGDRVSAMAAEFVRDSAGQVKSGYRVSTVWEKGDPKPSVTEAALDEKTWVPVSYMVNSPELIGLREPFSVQIVEKQGRFTVPLARGSYVVWGGKKLQVGPNGSVFVPFYGEHRGRYRFEFLVYPAGIGNGLLRDWPSTSCSFTATCVYPGNPKPSVSEVGRALFQSGGLRIAGRALGQGLKVNLGSKQLKEAVGSSLEKIFLDTPVMARGESAVASVAGADGAELAPKVEVKQPDFKVDHASAKLVGQRGTYTFNSNVDGWIRITGGEGYIALDERVFKVEADKPKAVGYTATMAGVYQTFFELSPNGQAREDDAPCETKVGKPKITKVGDKQHCEVPVEVKDGAGKGIGGDCNVVFHHGGGFETGTVHCDGSGMGTAVFDFGLNVDLTGLVTEILKVPGHQPNAQEAVMECCIKQITFTNDSDLPVYYRVYTPKTKTAKRNVFHTTEVVPPGKSITVTGDFGHCVRVAALRKPVPFDENGEGVTGLISDREVCCHGLGEEEFRSGAEGLRSVKILSAPCPKVGPPPVIEPPVPVEPPKPIDPPTWKPYEWPKIDWGGFNYWPKGYTYDGGLVPPTPPTSTPPTGTPYGEVMEVKDVDGSFEPIQAVWQSDEFFVDKPKKRITKIASASWNAELEMVVGKPTLVGGQLMSIFGYKQDHSQVEFRGVTNGTRNCPVKLKVFLNQGGKSKEVYDSGRVVDVLPLYGPAGAERPFSSIVGCRDGLPEELSYQRPFFFDPGPYQLVSELYTMDNKPTGIKVSVTGQAVETQGPTLYFFPTTMAQRTGPEWAQLVSKTQHMVATTSFWGPTAFPLKVGGMNCKMMPPLDLQTVYKKGQELDWLLWFGSFFVDDAKVSGKKDRQVTDGLVAFANSYMTTFSRLTGDGKVLLVMYDDDFDRTSYKAAECGAAAISQKLIFVRTMMGWMSIIHEITHTSPHIWSQDQMIAEYGFHWHNNPLNRVSEGIRIYNSTPFRHRFDQNWPMMGPYDVPERSMEIWITQAAYRQLLTHYQATPDPEVLDIQATFYDSATKGVLARLSPLYNSEAVPDPVNVVKSPYEVQILDATGKTIAKYPVKVDFRHSDDDGTSLFTAASLRVEKPAAAAAVQIVGPSGVMDKREIGTGAAPKISFAALPRVPKEGGDITVSWTGTASNGRPLEYSLVYTLDGEAWAPATIEQKGTSVTFNVSPGATNPKVKLVATDGGKSTSLVADLPK